MAASGGGRVKGRGVGRREMKGGKERDGGRGDR